MTALSVNHGSEQTLVMCRALRLHGTVRAVPSTLVPRLITYLILMISLLAQHPLAIHSQINENSVRDFGEIARARSHKASQAHAKIKLNDE